MYLIHFCFRKQQKSTSNTSSSSPASFPADFHSIQPPSNQLTMPRVIIATLTRQFSITSPQPPPISAIKRLVETTSGLQRATSCSVDIISRLFSPAAPAIGSAAPTRSYSTQPQPHLASSRAGPRRIMATGAFFRAAGKPIPGNWITAPRNPRAPGGLRAFRESNQPADDRDRRRIAAYRVSRGESGSGALSRSDTLKEIISIVGGECN